MSFKTSKYASSFSPQDLPGLVVWLDAADRSTFAFSSGSKISQWNDKSGNGYSVIQPTVSNQPTLTSAAQNTLSGIQLQSNLFLYQSGTSVSNFSTGASTSLFVAARNASANTGWNVISTIWFNAALSGATERYHFSFNNGSSPGPTLYLNSALIGRDSNNVVAPNSNAIIGFTGSSTSATLHTNGSSNSYAGATIPNANSSTLLIIGDNRNDSTVSSNIMIFEMVGFNVQLTNQQRQQVESYLAWKWGLVGNLPTAHPYKTAPIFMRPFNPLDISGCSLWLDAADYQTLTFSSGSNISAWRDKSGNGYNATAFNSPTYSTFNGILNGVTLNGSSTYFYYSNAGAMNTTSNLSAFVVAQAVFPSMNAVGWSRLLSFGDPDYVGVANAVAFDRYSNVNQLTYERNTAPPAPALTFGSTVSFVGSVVFNTNGVAHRINGASNSFTSGSTGAFNYSLYNIGRYSGGGPYHWAGMICEAITYNASLDSNQVQQVENYLAEKWNLRPSLSTSNALRLYRALSPVFNPTLLSNCALWVDSADFSTFVLSGTNVTTWKDKSGNGRDVSGYNNTATYNSSALGSGYPGLEFSSTRNMRVTIPAGTFSNGVHGFIVYRFTGPEVSGSVYGLLNRSVSAANALASPFTMYALNMYDYRFIGNGTGGSYNITSGNRYITNTSTTFYNFWLRSTANTTWNDSINGTTASHTTGDGVGAYGDTASDVVIGGRLDTAVFYQGVISEVILYSNALVDAERRVVEGYLAEKWGLARNLPNNHPYKTTPV